MKPKLNLFQLNSASTVVSEEMQRLDQLSDAALNSVDRLFQELGELVEKKRVEVISEVRRKRDEKKSVLQSQLREIELERNDVSRELSLVKQLDMFNLPSKIEEISTKLESVRWSGDGC